MRNIFEKLFNRDQPQRDYVIGQYSPSYSTSATRRKKNPEYDIDATIVEDEMRIDNIYKER